jgi:streptogramin lyase
LSETLSEFLSQSKRCWDAETTDKRFDKGIDKVSDKEKSARAFLTSIFGFVLLLPCFSLAVSAAQPPTISNFAGSGVKGFSGDGGPALEAQLNFPCGIARGPDGALYICDTSNHRVRKVTPDGKIATAAGTGEPGWSGDGGLAKAAKLNEPYEVRFDSAGDVYWVERLSHTVRKLEGKTGLIRTIAGCGAAGFSGDGGPATKAQLNEPHSIGFDPTGNLYICDIKNHRIRRVDQKTGLISTFAGTGERKSTPDGTSFANAPLNGPRALDFDKAGNLFLALREGNEILKLDVATGIVHHLAGTGKKGFSGDGGPAREATLSGPKGLSVASNGDIYLADTENHAIRRIDGRNGTIYLVAGTGVRGDGSQHEPLDCPMARPHGIFVDQDGSIFIGDSEAHRIRVIRGRTE